MELTEFNKKLNKLFANKTGCTIQDGNPCNTCFHNINADFQHICWLIHLSTRENYKENRKDILKDIEKELKAADIKNYCNKCNREVKDLNDNEREELRNEGSFVCSNCINEEMEAKK